MPGFLFEESGYYRRESDACKDAEDGLWLGGSDARIAVRYSRSKVSCPSLSTSIWSRIDFKAYRRQSMTSIGRSNHKYLSKIFVRNRESSVPYLLFLRNLTVSFPKTVRCFRINFFPHPFLIPLNLRRTQKEYRKEE